jgi:hypothetical protein
MTGRKLRNRLAGAASLAVAVAAVTMTLGAGAAFAAPGDPAGGATPVAPNFYNGNVESIRGSGSDTTILPRCRGSPTSTTRRACTAAPSTPELATHSTTRATRPRRPSNQESFCQCRAATPPPPTSTTTGTAPRCKPVSTMSDPVPASSSCADSPRAALPHRCPSISPGPRRQWSLHQVAGVAPWRPRAMPKTVCRLSSSPP